MLTCRRATERMSRALDGPLSPIAWVALRGHLILCDHCCRFRRQLAVLDAAARRAVDRPPDAGLPAVARARIAVAVEAALGGPDS
jgi:hypothetical protein